MNFFLSKILLGEDDPRGCAGCVGTLAGTIVACLADLVDWPLVIVCVGGVLGTGDACYPCICWVIEELYGDISAC